MWPKVPGGTPARRRFFGIAISLAPLPSMAGPAPSSCRAGPGNAPRTLPSRGGLAEFRRVPSVVLRGGGPAPVLRRLCTPLPFADAEAIGLPLQWILLRGSEWLHHFFLFFCIPQFFFLWSECFVFILGEWAISLFHVWRKEHCIAVFSFPNNSSCVSPICTMFLCAPVSPIVHLCLRKCSVSYKVHHPHILAFLIPLCTN